MSLFNHCLETVGKKKERKKTREARRDLLVIADHLEGIEEDTGGLVKVARKSLGIPSDVSLEHFMTKPDVKAVIDPQVTVDDGEMALEQLSRLIDVSERNTYDRSKWYSEVSFAVNEMCAELDYPVECLRMGEHKSLRHNRAAIEGIANKAWGAVRAWWKNRLTTPNALFINNLSEDGSEAVTLSSRFTELGRVAAESNHHRDKGTLGTDSVALARACASKGIFLTKEDPEEILKKAFDTLIGDKSAVLSRLSRNITTAANKSAEDLSAELYESVANGLKLEESTTLAKHLRVEKAGSNGDWFFLEIVQTLNKGKCTLEHRHNNRDVADRINFNKLCKFALEASAKYQYYTKGIERGSEDILAVISTLVDSEETITQEMTEYTLGIIRYYDTHRECVSNIITHMNDIMSALNMVTHEITAAPPLASDKPPMTTEELSHEVIDVGTCYDYITAGIAVEYDNKNELMNEVENYNRAINACVDFSAAEVIHLEISQEELAAEGFFKGVKNLGKRMWEALTRMFRMIRKKMMKFAYWITGNKYKSSKKAKGTKLVKTASGGGAFSGSGGGSTSDFTYDGHYSDVDGSAGSGGKKDKKAKKKEKKERRENLNEDNNKEDKNGKVFGERTGDEEAKHQKQEKKKRKESVVDLEKDARLLAINKSKQELATWEATRTALRHTEGSDLGKLIKARNEADDDEIEALQVEIDRKMAMLKNNKGTDKYQYNKSEATILQAEREYFEEVEASKVKSTNKYDELEALLDSAWESLNRAEARQEETARERAKNEEKKDLIEFDASAVEKALAKHIKESAKIDKVDKKEASKAANKINKTNMDISALLIKHQEQAVKVEGFETEKEARKRLRNNKREIVKERKKNQKLVEVESQRVSVSLTKRTKRAVKEGALKQETYDILARVERVSDEMDASKIDEELSKQELKKAHVAVKVSLVKKEKVQKEEKKRAKISLVKAKAKLAAVVEHAESDDVKLAEITEAVMEDKAKQAELKAAKEDRIEREERAAKKAIKQQKKEEKRRAKADHKMANDEVDAAMAEWADNMRAEQKRMDEVAARAIDEAYMNDESLKAKKKQDKIDRKAAAKLEESNAIKANAAQVERSRQATSDVYENKQANYFPMYDGASTINIREPLILYRFLVGTYRDTLEGIYKNLEKQREAVGQWALEEARYIRDGARNSIGQAVKPAVMTGGLASVITGRNTFINTYILGDYKTLNLRKEEIMVPMTSRDLDKYVSEPHDERPLRMGLSPDEDDTPMLNVKVLIDAIFKAEKLGRKINTPYDVKEATDGLKVCFEAQLAAAGLERYRVECIDDNLINTLEFIEAVEEATGKRT